MASVIIVANVAGPNEAPPATGILAAAEVHNAGPYGSQCPYVMFIGARGSGEAPQSNWYSPSAYTADTTYHGLGAELWSLYLQLVQGQRAAIAFEPVMYPASNVFALVNGNYKLYTASVASGASAVVSDIELLDAGACQGLPHYYVLAGYSQGAWVIHDALHMMTAKQLAEVSGVALFGDPDFIPFKSWVRIDKWVDVFPGSAALVDHSNTSIPAAVASRTASYCFQGDPVCQTWPGTIATTLPWCIAGSVANCPHLRYVLDGETAKAAAFLIPFLPN